MSGKKHQEPLNQAWAESLLAASSGGHAGSVFDRLQAAKAELERAQAEAQHHLSTNPLTELAAKEAMAKAGKRGIPKIEVSPLGDIHLVVSYAKATAPHEGSTPRRSWKSRLPTISELRAKAADLGIDPEPFGRNKTKLQQAIRRAEAQPPHAAEPSKPKMIKTAPAVSDVTVVEFEVPEEPQKPKRKGMAALALQAKSVDLEEMKTSIDVGGLDLDLLLGDED